MTIIDKAGREGQRKLAKLELGLKFGSEEMIHEKLELVIIFGGEYPDSRFRGSTFHLTNVHGIARG